MSSLKEKMESLDRENYGYNEGENYMSDTKNWVCIHVTKYEPQNNSEGNLSIKTTGMATGYELPRATVHVTLNQIVSSHMGGNWDAVPIVVLAPYEDVVSKNGNPSEVAAEDTYFTPNPDTGLVLPESAYIIKPNPNNEKLIEIGEHGATYKTDNYTDQEIEEILSICDNWDRKQYERYVNGIVSEYEVPAILGYDDKLIKVYENTKDKQAFMRGIFEEKRFDMLNNILRNATVKMSLEKMGYHYVEAHEDSVSGKIAAVAREAGIEGDSGNKGHSCSVEYELEIQGCAFSRLAKVLKSKNVDDIYDYLTEYKRPLSDEITANILSDTPLPDIHETFEQIYNDYVSQRRSSLEIDKAGNFTPAEFITRRENYLKKMEKGLKEYSPHLYTTLSRHSRRIMIECTQALKELKQDPKVFAELKQRLSGNKENISEIFEDNSFSDSTRTPNQPNSDFLSIFAESKKNKR